MISFTFAKKACTNIRLKNHIVHRTTASHFIFQDIPKVTVQSIADSNQ